ncbi:hypothetical protein PUNSTDRAFT_144315 [Punctularia strigosozonata HHB-11173 SS5]|uniref:uncharacterized protein n=1 Tax=Punctularia strigosozonata (strain HHB-11173) TaxID=741275 RepID=UPI0004416691|nr:uncharacterized protein PUNSTDRAFT_144315 [Punctularia strigosozonata HHB-11173 SS5]EIN07778.1 hypothetical protein PUNSTDRAFT_144315 [Punctularia strigosozonata HHB-11173 SS5]
MIRIGRLFDRRDRSPSPSALQRTPRTRPDEANPPDSTESSTNIASGVSHHPVRFIVLGKLINGGGVVFLPSSNLSRFPTCAVKIRRLPHRQRRRTRQDREHQDDLCPDVHQPQARVATRPSPALHVRASIDPATLAVASTAVPRRRRSTIGPSLGAPFTPAHPPSTDHAAIHVVVRLAHPAPVTDAVDVDHLPPITAAVATVPAIVSPRGFGVVTVTIIITIFTSTSCSTHSPSSSARPAHPDRPRGDPHRVRPRRPARRARPLDPRPPAARHAPDGTARRVRRRGRRVARGGRDPGDGRREGGGGGREGARAAQARLELEPALDGDAQAAVAGYAVRLADRVGVGRDVVCVYGRARARIRGGEEEEEEGEQGRARAVAREAYRAGEGDVDADARVARRGAEAGSRGRAAKAEGEARVLALAVVVQTVVAAHEAAGVGQCAGVTVVRRALVAHAAADERVRRVGLAFLNEAEDEQHRVLKLPSSTTDLALSPLLLINLGLTLLKEWTRGWNVFEPVLLLLLQSIRKTF